MVTTKRTDSSDPHFRELVRALDKDLEFRDGDEHPFYAQFNKIDNLQYVVVAYEQDKAVGCGAIKDYAHGIMEVKRMFVPQESRGRGIASIVLHELETWCRELHCTTCILETGKKQPEAIGLYMKNGYKQIANFGQYAHVENSVCFEKQLK